MSKIKYYYVKFQEIENPDVKYRGIILEAKRDRALLFRIHNGCGLTEDKYTITKCVEISKKVFDRLNHLKQLREEKEYQEWIANGGREKARKHLAELAALNAYIRYMGGPYGKDGF